MSRHFYRLATITALIPLLAACNLTKLRSEIQKAESQIPAPPPLACTLTSPSIVVNSGDTVGLAVAITGGTSPYSLQVVGRTIDVSPSFTLGHVFINNTNAPVSQTFSITVVDETATSTSCSVSVSVASNTSPPPALACSISANPSQPEVLAPVTYTFTATGGSGADTFTNLQLGSSSTVTSVLQTTGTHSASASGVYSAPGTKQVSAMVSDSGGNSAACSLNVAVRQPSLSVTLNPASGIVPSGQSITITLGTSGFGSGATPLYYFYSAENGISITRNGNTATVRATDQSAHDFVVTVAAEDPNSSDIATGFAHIVFTSTRSPLSCTVGISAHSGTLYPVLPFYYYYYDASVSVPASAAATGVQITNVEVDGATYTYYSENPSTVAITFLNGRILEPSQRPVTVELSIKDSLGRTATCESSSTVWAY